MSTWFLLPLIEKTPYTNYLNVIDNQLGKILSTLNPTFYHNDQVSIFQFALKNITTLKQSSIILDQYLFLLLKGIIVFLIIKSFFSIIIGRPISYLFLELELKEI